MKTIYLLQGLGQTTQDWNEVINHLPPDYNVRLIDSFQIGFVNESYSLEQAAHVLEKEIEKDEEGHKIVCGLSLGAVIAAQHALMYPSKKVKYILSSFHPSPPKAIMALQTLVFTIFWRLIRSGLGVDKDKQQVLSVLKSVKERDFSQDLLHLQQVRLLLVGEKDAIHVKAAKSIGQRFPNSEIKIIQNAGHEINEDQPIALANEIINLD